MLNTKVYNANRHYMDNLLFSFFFDFDASLYRNFSDTGTEYVFTGNFGILCATERLNKIANENYEPEQIVWAMDLDRLVTIDLKYITTKPDSQGYSYWMKRI